MTRMCDPPRIDRQAEPCPLTLLTPFICIKNMIKYNITQIKCEGIDCMTQDL